MMYLIDDIEVLFKLLLKLCDKFQSISCTIKVCCHGDDNEAVSTLTNKKYFYDFN